MLSVHHHHEHHLHHGEEGLHNPMMKQQGPPLGGHPRFRRHRGGPPRFEGEEEADRPQFWRLHERKTFSSTETGGAAPEEKGSNPAALAMNDHHCTMLPPPVHEKFKIPIHTGALTLLGLIIVSFCRPSFCRFKLAGYVFVLFIFTAAAFLHHLKEHTEQRFDYCTDLATKEYQVVNVMSVSIGPFDAISVVKSPVMKRLDIPARDRCVSIVEAKRDFILNIVLHVCSLFSFVLLCLIVNDWKKSIRALNAQLGLGNNNNDNNSTSFASDAAPTAPMAIVTTSTAGGADFTLEEQNAQKSVNDPDDVDEDEDEQDENASLISTAGKQRQVEYIIVETQEP